jgi:hypothetical protein
VDRVSALKAVHAAGKTGVFALSYHADAEKLPELGLFPEDVRSALENAVDGIVDDDSGARWKIYGPAANGEVIAVVVRFRAERVPLVVTLHPIA